MQPVRQNRRNGRFHDLQPTGTQKTHARIFRRRPQEQSRHIHGQELLVQIHFQKRCQQDFRRQESQDKRNAPDSRQGRKRKKHRRGIKILHLGISPAQKRTSARIRKNRRHFPESEPAYGHRKGKVLSDRQKRTRPHRIDLHLQRPAGPDSRLPVLRRQEMERCTQRHRRKRLRTGIPGHINERLQNQV